VTGVSVGHFAQPVTRRATGPHANYHKTGQATEYLSTGKGHELNYLTYQPGAEPAKGEYDTPAVEKQ
jgi:hypothetical protein